VYLIGVSKVARYEISTALLLRHVIFWHVTLCIGVNAFPCSIVRVLEVFQTLEEVGMQCLEQRNPIYQHFFKSRVSCHFAYTYLIHTTLDIVDNNDLRINPTPEDQGATFRRIVGLS